jgi:hypothetical protein
MSLSFTFDDKQAAEYVFRSPFVSVQRPSQFLRGTKDEYIIKELAASLQGTEDWSLSGGILSIK